MRLELVDEKFDYYFQWYEYSALVDRPCIPKTSSDDKWKRYLTDEIHFWFKEFNIEYSLDFSTMQVGGYGLGHIRWYIDIPNDNHAMLFKLIWI